MLTFEQLQQQMQDLSEVVRFINDEHVTTIYRFLNERIAYPESFVVMLGETSSGKTSIINGLLGAKTLPVSANPTTGTVIEVMDDPDLTMPEYYAVHQSATLEHITEEKFTVMCSKPEIGYSRMRLIIPAFPKKLTGLRLFDTPGYASLHKEHDEVLKEFIPNSDIIIYVVSYRVGFQASDHEFLRYVEELIDQSTEFILAINRTPLHTGSNDRRIQEILESAGDCLHRKLPYHIITSAPVNESGERLPVEASSLWKNVHQSLANERRQQSLQLAFTRYQYDLVLTLRIFLERELIRLQTTKEEQAIFTRGVSKLEATEKEICDLIDITFTKLSNQVESLFSRGAKDAYKIIHNEIYAAGKWTEQQECAGFIQQHLLPLQVRIQGQGISEYFYIELEELDRKINNMLNGALKEFNTDIELHAPLFMPLVNKAGKKLANHLADAGLQAFFAQFGGAGGAGAGVANAAKKGLKMLGNLIGKKFSRETHNAVVAFLKKIGATSTRALTVAASVVVEAIFYIYDAKTWQGKLAKEVEKVLSDWAGEASTGVRKDLHELRDDNLKKVSELLNNYYNLSFDENDSPSTIDVGQLNILLEQVKGISEKLEKELEE